ncbi:MAG: hypothetical protein R3Y07_03755 [Eubacteriales bacterium]
MGLLDVFLHKKDKNKQKEPTFLAREEHTIVVTLPLGEKSKALDDLESLLEAVAVNKVDSIRYVAEGGASIEVIGSDDTFCAKYYTVKHIVETYFCYVLRNDHIKSLQQDTTYLSYGVEHHAKQCDILTFEKTSAILAAFIEGYHKETFAEKILANIGIIAVEHSESFSDGTVVHYEKEIT